GVNASAASKSSGLTQPASVAGRPRSVPSTSVPPTYFSTGDDGPASLRGTAAYLGQRFVEAGAPDERAWDDPAGETVEPGYGDGATAEEGPVLTSTKRKRRRKAVKRGFETQLALSIIEERFAADLAAFVARGGAVPAPPPLPYRPTHHGEAYELT